MATRLPPIAPPAAAAEAAAEPEGERLVFELKAQPASVEVRCLAEDIGADVPIGGGALRVGAHARNKPWTEEHCVELRDDRGRPTGAVRVVLSWTPNPAALHRLCIAVCSWLELAAAWTHCPV